MYRLAWSQVGQEKDTFALKKDSFLRPNEDFTKRSYLALLAQMCEPIGLIASVTLKHLQELWTTGYGWDDTLLEATQQK